ncbi:TetR/AcrR family transcriptional regulator [Corynebacterium guangdongense]|uniref:DNA-binding transcriptional regulator YbjK n=1 Tax=Corynebacterium guangdongense TaxID=1783348 RepID=A0ABU1ZYP8_9CORY|nr:TetR family transcriptional regulator [Corynebacterium guangdongense]MDR7330041.1 DNA-binding transcriptional regulator YbjK [Corynebacterium guangdongense]WJZ18599.1 putative DNA-binding transcriptional regulator [Corynebacterium guangdongense]
MSSARECDTAVVRRGQQTRALEKKRLILDAAAELMLENSLRGVTHRQVAARAGVPVGSIGYYYNTREELVATAIARLGDRRHRHALQLIEKVSAPTTPEQAADLLLEVLLGHCVSESALRSWLATGVDCTRESEELNDSLRSPCDQLRADIAAALEATGFAKFSADSVIVTVAGAVVLCMVDRDADCVGTTRDNLVELLGRCAE